jgi:hypothetical protein
MDKFKKIKAKILTITKSSNRVQTIFKELGYEIEL